MKAIEQSFPTNTFFLHQSLGKKVEIVVKETFVFIDSRSNTSHIIIETGIDKAFRMFINCKYYQYKC